MNRSDIVHAIAAAEGVDLVTAERLLKTMLNAITVSLACGENVTIRNFGKFEVRNRKPVTRVNPRTKQVIDVPEKRAVLFHPSPALKDRINKNGQKP